MRTKKAFYNSLTSLLLQVVTVVCGFILPRFILSSFGSEVNGAISSISQFLGYISLLEAGVGGVTRAALYKPLAEYNSQGISGIANATQNFFKKIAYIFFGYVIIVAVVFKNISNTNLEWWFTASLVLIIAISTFTQYYFGITNTLILQADQKKYIPNGIQIGTVLLNTAISVVLIKAGASIQIVKLASSIIYIIRPIALSIIVKRKYSIDSKVPADNNAIKQRWNSLGHHSAYFIHNNTDIMVTTVFLGLKSVSVYAVYFMILTGVRNIVNAIIGGGEAAFGNMIAKNERGILNNRFKMMETLSSIIVIVFFSTAGMVLIDFVKIYTSRIEDINYIFPVFGVLMVISEAIHCIKQQYHSLVLAAGHYKETQIGAFVEAGINLVLSIVLVNWIGLPGTIIATIFSSLFRTVDYVVHLKNHILHREITIFVKRQLVNIVNVLVILGICIFIPFWECNGYLSWAAKSVCIVVISTVITVAINFILYREDMQGVGLRIKHLIKE